MLSTFFGADDRIDVTSDALPGTVRTFQSYSAIANEAGLSRIYAGQHTPLDDTAGRLLGTRVAEFTATLTGEVAALSRAKGSIVWTSQLPAGSNSTLAITGDTLLAGAGIPLSSTEHPALVAYRLG